MKYILIAIFLIGCGGDTSTIYVAEKDENGTVLPMYIDDQNVSDIINIIDVNAIAATDNGIIVICVDGAICSVTTDDGNDSADNINTTDNNSSS